MRLLSAAAMAALFVVACNPRKFNTAEVKDAAPSCQGEIIDVARYVRNQKSCFRTEVEAKRNLYSWIPCNAATLLTHAENPLDKNQDILNYLSAADAPFKPLYVDPVFANPRGNGFPWEQGNPILQRPIARAIREIIANAKETLFYDVFLLGGTWGLDIVRELLRAADRGVKVVVLRDSDNKVGVGPEMEPLWEALVARAQDNPNLTVLRSEIHHRPSAIPFGLNHLIQGFDAIGDFPVSLAGKSDHSKTIVADGLTLNPRMLVGSKNTVDSAGSFFYDEVLSIQGPAAAAAQLAYGPDLRLARELSARENPGKGWDSWFEGFLGEIEARRSGAKPAPVRAAGPSSALLAENNGDDSVRNVESTVLALIGSAKRSVDLYDFLSYNPAVGQALAAAMKRGVRVRVLMDAIAKKIPLNSTLVYFTRDAGAPEDVAKAAIRWRNQLAPVNPGPGRILLAQQQHVKTIIVDGETVLAGSANFDAGTFTGSFREMSMAVRDPNLGAQATRNFEAVYNSPDHALPFDALRDRDPSLFDRAKVKAAMDVLVAEGARIHALGADTVGEGCLAGGQ